MKELTFSKHKRVVRISAIRISAFRISATNTFSQFAFHRQNILNREFNPRIKGLT